MYIHLVKDYEFMRKSNLTNVVHGDCRRTYMQEMKLVISLDM